MKLEQNLKYEPSEIRFEACRDWDLYKMNHFHLSNPLPWSYFKYLLLEYL